MARNRKKRAEEYDPDADLREGYEGEEKPSTGRPGRMWVPTTVIASIAAAALAYTYLGRLSLLLLVAIPIALVVRAVSRSGLGASRRTYRDLVRRCGGDVGMADRLIRAELARNPGLDRDEAAERALWTLNYDRGR
jgi:hypothetical protein